MSPTFFDVMAERNDLDVELSELRSTLHYLIGYYERPAELSGVADFASLIGELRLAVGLPVNDEPAGDPESGAS